MTAIDAAVVVFDKYNPGWMFKLDKDRLDVSSPDDCPVGQLYGGTFKRELLKLYECYGDFPREAFDRLTQAWKEAVAHLCATRPDLSYLPWSVPPVEEMSPVLNGWFLDKDEACTNR